MTSMAIVAGQLKEDNAVKRTNFGPLGVGQDGSTPYVAPGGRVAVPANGYSAIAGPEGVAYGFQGGQARNSAEVLKMRNDAQTAKNVARTNMAYGYLPSMRGNLVYNEALANKTVIGGAIDRNVGLVRDAGQAANIGGAEESARQASINAANTGLTGSSTDQDNKRNVLGSYLGGRADVAQQTSGARIAGQDAMEKERLAAIDRVRGQSGVDLPQQIADTYVLNSLGEAKRNIVPQAIGSGLEAGGNFYASNLLYNQAVNGGGGGASNARMPSLSSGSAPTGGYTGGGFR